MSEVRVEHEVALPGCRPEPLASYLKALGVLRLVAQQKDPHVRGCFRGEQFVLWSTLDAAALAQFFEQEYVPTPVIAPWNGGSGFYPKDNRKAADAIVASKHSRFREYADAIRIARAFIEQKGWTERPADENKLNLISTLRALLPDAALAWLDAALVLGDDRLLFPPLLGTGGNDGRLDFSNNFQQRVTEVLEGRADRHALAAALFGVAQTSSFSGAMGQYQPAANEKTNPWDFVLLIEGALLFAAAATRRYENAGSAALAFPFHARAAGGLATVTEGDESESRDELWLPYWSQPATLRELRQLFSEGRATVGTGQSARSAATALDFARAVGALGVDRGIEGFIRVGFHVRNGLAYYATPLGRFRAREVEGVRLLDDIDSWFDRLRRACSSSSVPARVALAKRRAEQAMFEAAQTGRLAPLLLELGACERALAQSLSFTQKAFLSPLRPLRSAWAEAVADESPEQRLAAALALRRNIRRRLIPLDGGAFGRADEPTWIFTERNLVENLLAMLLREEVEEQQGAERHTYNVSQARCSLGDIAAFIDGRVNDALIEAWLRAAVLVDGGLHSRLPGDGVLPPATYSVLALAHGRTVGGAELPRTATLLARACSGDAAGATSAALRRLNAAGRPLPISELYEPALRTRRIAAALAFPISAPQRLRLERAVLGADEALIAAD